MRRCCQRRLHCGRVQGSGRRRSLLNCSVPSSAVAVNGYEARLFCSWTLLPACRPRSDRRTVAPSDVSPAGLATYPVLHQRSSSSHSQLCFHWIVGSQQGQAAAVTYALSSPPHRETVAVVCLCLSLSSSSPLAPPSPCPVPFEWSSSSSAPSLLWAPPSSRCTLPWRSTTTEWSDRSATALRSHMQPERHPVLTFAPSVTDAVSPHVPLPTLLLRLAQSSST